MQFITKESKFKDTPKRVFGENFRLQDHFRVVKEGNSTVAEFQSTGDFSSQWFARQRYEVYAGRDSEPTLYEPLYEIVRDPSLPKSVTVYRLGPAGVIFDEVLEGGEVKFASIAQTNNSIPIKHYGVGLEYTKDLFMFNELWRLPLVERQAGIAYNALLNHVHLNPIISASYTGSNLTTGTGLTTFRTTASMAEKYQRALEAALTTMTQDTVNPRRGPYYILTSIASKFTWERALTQGATATDGFTASSSVGGMIRGVIAYDGWSGVRGAKTVSYGGVASTDAYIVDIGSKAMDFNSFVKQDLDVAMGNADVSRFILDQVVWDTYFGVYANPTAGAHKLVLPLATSGQA